MTSTCDDSRARARFDHGSEQKQLSLTDVHDGVYKTHGPLNIQGQMILWHDPVAVQGGDQEGVSNMPS